MRLKAFLLIIGLSLVGVAVHAADVGWKGPGWYVVAAGMVIDTGPYDSQAACQAAKPPDDGEFEYDCIYLGAEP